tara:strand:- start:1535 stop:1669 length:135 start_codon:yes stop_codon:yes gene_type:complete
MKDFLKFVAGFLSSIFSKKVEKTQDVKPAKPKPLNIVNSINTLP